MATVAAASARKQEYSPPAVNGDFYKIADVLDPKERAVVKRVRDFMETEVAPIIEDYWGRDQFPHEIIPKLRMLDVNIAGVGYRGYGSAGGSWLLNGFIAMEMARVDSSVATFWGVHTGLSAGSIYLCGDEAQKQRWLPPMMRWEKIGCFGLTEPLVGSEMCIRDRYRGGRVPGLRLRRRELAAQWLHRYGDGARRLVPVSYTHLTLPTKRIV